MKEGGEPGTYYIYVFGYWLPGGSAANPRSLNVTADTSLEAWYWRDDDTGIERTEPG